MNKLVIKTVIITFITFVAVFLMIYACLAAASPKTVADAWADLGSYTVSVKYYEKQYYKTESVADLATVCDKIDEENDSARAVEYLSALTGSEEFSAFCAAEDGKRKTAFTAYEFYYGKYAAAKFYESGIDAAITVAKNAAEKGYTDYNAFRWLISLDALTQEDGEKAAAAIAEMKAGLTDEEQVFADRDISLAQSIK